MRTRTIIFGLFILVMGIWSCRTKDITQPNENMPPTTTLANIPVDGDTVFALARIEWDGGDDDGYIIGYEWKYTTTYLSSGEQVELDWQFTEETSLTIAFNSGDPTGNQQEFQVRSIDNSEVADPTPAVKTFFTLPTAAPEIDIVTPTDELDFFALQQVTDWFLGIPLTYTGNDLDEFGQITEWGWSVDGNEYHWTTDTTLYIDPADIPAPFYGAHEIGVIARDNTNILSEEAKVTINLIQPTFEKDILIIDETVEEFFPPSARTTDAHVDSFYAELFGVPNIEEDHWDYEYHELRGNPLPSLEKIGQYKMILWHADNQPSGGAPHKLALHEDLFKNYMSIGGDFFMSGWRILKSFAWGKAFPTDFEEDSFVGEYLHILRANESPVYLGDFVGGYGIYEGFTDIYADSSKLEGYPYNNMMVQVNTIEIAGGFTDILYRYIAPPDSPFRDYAGQPVGLLYSGTVFDAVILGFPVYFLRHQDAVTMTDKILQLLSYR